MDMVGDQLFEPFLIMPCHVTGYIHPSLVVQVAAVMMEFFQNVIFLGNRLKFHHGHIAPFGKITGFIQHIGGREIASRLPDDDDNTAGHIFATVIADTFNNGNGAGIAHGKPFPGDTAEITFPFNRTIKNRIADNDGIFGNDLAVFRRPDDNTSATQALADIIVAVSNQVEGDATCQKCTERLPCRSPQGDRNRVIGKSLETITARNLARQHGAG